LRAAICLCGKFWYDQRMDKKTRPADIVTLKNELPYSDSPGSWSPPEDWVKRNLLAAMAWHMTREEMEASGLKLFSGDD
jgi:hypothetical protein